MSTEKFLFEIAADTKALRSELGKAHTSSEKLGKGIKKTELDFKKFGKKSAKGVAAVAAAVAAATVAFTAFAVAQGRAIRETEALALMAGVTTEEFKKMSFVMGTAGISGEKYGDIMKDTQEKVGDFLATGGGAFQDFADVMGLSAQEAGALAKEFETMTGQQVLQAMVNQMEDAGKSTQQMSFALEGMASDTTRLIPLLRDGGAAAENLGDQFDSINVELTEEEKKQFALLATNVDLAQDSFVNFLNNAISPFLPAINLAATALAEFFATASSEFNLGDVMGDNSLLKQVKTLEEINELQKTATDRLRDKAANKKAFSLNQEMQKRSIEDLESTIIKINERKQAIKEENEERQKTLDLESKKGNLTGTRSSIDEDEKNQAALDAIQDRFKSEIELLGEKYEEEKRILDKVVEDKVERDALKLQLESEYNANVLEVNNEAREAELEEHKRVLDERAKLELKAGSAKTSLEESVAKNGVDLLKMVSGESKAAALIALGIQKASALSANATATLSGSMLAYASQLIPGDPTSIARAEAARNYTTSLGALNAGLIVATGLTEAASITSGGGGSFNGSGGGESAPEQQTFETFNDQGASITDISSGESSTTKMQILFTDDVIDILAQKVETAKQNGRV